MNNPDYTYSSLPIDVALKIASSLEVLDLSSLGCCSRVWRELCGSDFLWESLFRQRWPHLFKEALLKRPQFEGWRAFYIKQHKEMAQRAASVVKFVEQSSHSEFVEVSDYLHAIGSLILLQFGFKDVQMFLFKPQLDVLINLVGVHYCMKCLQVPGAHVLEALKSSKISDRQFFVKWWKLGRWFYGFRMQDEFYSQTVSLQDLATAKELTVLGVLDRGAIHEVLRVQISSVKSSTNNPCSSQSSQC